jgi:hypothetical protein
VGTHGGYPPDVALIPGGHSQSTVTSRLGESRGEMHSADLGGIHRRRLFELTVGRRAGRTDEGCFEVDLTHIDSRRSQVPFRRRTDEDHTPDRRCSSIGTSGVWSKAE